MCASRSATSRIADLGQAADLVELAAEHLGARDRVQPLGQDRAGDRVERGLPAARRPRATRSASTTRCDLGRRRGAGRATITWRYDGSRQSSGETTAL